MNFKLALKTVPQNVCKFSMLVLLNFLKTRKLKKKKRERERKERKRKEKKPTLGTPSPANFSFLPSPISINEGFILRNA